MEEKDPQTNQWVAENSEVMSFKLSQKLNGRSQLGGIDVALLS